MTEEKKISEYLEVLSSKAPVPGGGGASALAGALGNALGQMVVNLTVGKKKYAEVEEEMQKYLTDLKNMRRNSCTSPTVTQKYLRRWQNVTACHPPPWKKKSTKMPLWKKSC